MAVSRRPSVLKTIHEATAQNGTNAAVTDSEQSNRERRKELASVFAQNMQVLSATERCFNPQTESRIVPGIKGTFKPQKIDVKPAGIKGTFNPIRINVQPFEGSTKKITTSIEQLQLNHPTQLLPNKSTKPTSLELETRMDATISKIKALRKFEKIPFTTTDGIKDILSESECEIRVVNDSIKKFSFKSKDIPSLAVCEKLVNIFKANVEVLDRNLQRLRDSGKKSEMHLRTEFINVAATIASTPPIRTTQLQSGAHSQTTLVTYPNFIKYVLKTPHDTESSRKAIAKEVDINYFLPKIDGVMHFFGVNADGYPLLEHIPGKELCEEDNDNEVNCDDVFEIGKNLATTLAALYKETKLIHCDIKPENVIVKNNKPVLIDFGKAQTEFTDNDNVTGTNNYAPPEFLFSGLERTAKVDCFCFGTTLFTKLTGAFFYGELANSFGYDLPQHYSRGDLRDLLTKIDESSNLDDEISKVIFSLGLLEDQNPVKATLHKALILSLKDDPKKRASMEELAAIFNS